MFVYILFKIHLNNSGIIAESVNFSVNSRNSSVYHAEEKYSQGGLVAEGAVGGTVGITYYITGDDPLREFIYSEDVARLTEWALENYDEEEPIIFSTSDEISIGNVAEMIVYYIGFKGKLVFDDEKPDGQFRKPSDNSKLLSYLPDFKFTPMEEGIEKSVNWFVENYEEARK